MPTGLTASAGWQAGVRRTIPAAPADVWSLIVSEGGQRIWLGATIALERGAGYELPDGTTGEVRAVSDAHVRLTWAPPDWGGESTVQVRVLPAASGATISFHHERLSDAQERERALAHWRRVLDGIERAVLGEAQTGPPTTSSGSERPARSGAHDD